MAGARGIVEVMAQLEIVYLNPAELTPYEGNTRKHAAPDIDQIKASIQADGFNDPIGIWGEKNLIVEGHGRQIAALEMGIDRVPCIRLDHLTDAQRRDYAIRHNFTSDQSEFDFDRLREEVAALELQGLDMSYLDSLSEELDGLNTESVDDYNIVEDEPPEPPEEPTAKRGQIWRLGQHRLMCGDSTDPDDVAALMDGASADLLLTDPPYNVALGHYGSAYDARKLHRRTDGLLIENDSWEDDDDFVEFLVKCFTNALDSMKPGAAFYIWYASNQSLNFLRAAEKAEMEIRQHLIWNKGCFTLGRQDYQWKHEPCLYGWKDGAAHYFVDIRNMPTVFEDGTPDISKMKKEEMASLLKEIYADKVPTTVINEDKPSRSELHPTMKPIKLLARQIQNSTKRGWKVLDLFGGSGSTMIACEQLGRKCYMMELDPHYADVIIQRWETMTGGKAELLN
jgi:site-specific DNA-methyltransferase (adenine-specific)